MQTTEDDAYLNWCPFYRTAGAGNLDVTEFHDNRPAETSELDDPANCIGSRCMAWRWKMRDVRNPSNVVTHKAALDIGYCGLVGKPD